MQREILRGHLIEHASQLIWRLLIQVDVESRLPHPIVGQKGSEFDTTDNMECSGWGFGLPIFV